MKVAWYPFPDIRPLDNGKDKHYWVYVREQSSPIGGLHWEASVSIMRFDVRLWLAVGVTFYADIELPEKPTDETITWH